MQGGQNSEHIRIFLKSTCIHAQLTGSTRWVVDVLKQLTCLLDMDAVFLCLNNKYDSDKNRHCCTIYEQYQEGTPSKVVKLRKASESF